MSTLQGKKIRDFIVGGETDAGILNFLRAAHVNLEPPFQIGALCLAVERDRDILELNEIGKANSVPLFVIIKAVLDLHPNHWQLHPVTLALELGVIPDSISFSEGCGDDECENCSQLATVELVH